MVKKTVEITKPPSGSPGGGFLWSGEGKPEKGNGKAWRESRRRIWKETQGEQEENEREAGSGRLECTLKGVRNKYGKRQGCVVMLRYSL